MTRRQNGILKPRQVKRNRTRRFIRFIQELKQIDSEANELELGAAELLVFSRTKNIAQDENEIKNILDRNKGIFLNGLNRIRSIANETNALYKLALSDRKSKISARTRIKRCNSVLRKFVDAVRYAESAERALLERTQQTLSCYSNVFSAIQIGDAHFLVEGKNIASLTFSDMNHITGENFGFEKSIEQLKNASKEVEEQIATNRSVLIDVGEEEEDPYRRIVFYDIRDSMTISTISTSSSGSTSFGTDGNELNIKGPNYKGQRNAALTVAVIAAISLVAFTIFYLVS